MRNIVCCLSIVLIAVLFSNILQAQDCEAYFPMEEGAFMETTSYDAKDKVTGKMNYLVLSKTVEGNNMAVTVKTTTFDKKDKEVHSGEMEMACVDGVFIIDMKNYLDPESMGDMGEMEVSIDATNLEIPADLQVGQTLPDGYIKINFETGGMSMMGMTVNIIDRTVEAIEDVTTPAGTFTCHIISQTIETKAIMKIVAKSKEWYAKDVGVVKSESYNKKGKLTGYSILTDFKL